MWTHTLTAAIGGLEDVGFVNNKEELVVLSSQGLGVFNCSTGENLFRSPEEWWPFFDQAIGILTKIPGYDNSSIRLSGLHCQNNLRLKTVDGWELFISDPEMDEPPFEKYQVQNTFLVRPDGRERFFIGKDGPCEKRAFGFSDTNNSLVFATSCELIVWTRK